MLVDIWYSPSEAQWIDVEKGIAKMITCTTYVVALLEPTGHFSS